MRVAHVLCRCRQNALFCNIILAFTIACVIYLGTRYCNYHHAASDGHIVVAISDPAAGRANPSWNSRETWARQQSLHQLQQPSAGERHADRADSFNAHGRAKMDKRLGWNEQSPPIEMEKLDVGKSRRDGIDSSSGPKAGGATLPVYIVEEHHEVLPYWHGAFAAAKKRTGKSLSPLSLVHIDGHSDGAAIIPDKRYPFSAKIGSANKIKYLMTSNDNFIMGSKFAGLVSNGLWIFPKWTNDTATDIDIRRIGIVKMNDSLQSCDCPHYEQDRRPIMEGGRNSSDTCLIDERIDLENRVWFQRKFCYFLKGPYLQINAPEDKITSHVLSAVLARKVLLPAARPDESTIGSLYQPVEKPEDHNDYLLDIDEDFFGVQLAGRQLVSAGIPLSIDNKMRQSLEQLFCPSHIGHEIEADRWFVEMLNSVVMYQSLCDKPSGHGNDCFSGNAASIVVQDMMQKTLLVKAACPQLPAFEVRRLIERIVLTIVKLTPDQLRVLKSVGLCLGISLKTNLNPLNSLTKEAKVIDDKGRRSPDRMIPQPIVQLCLGHNQPNQSIVQEFLDTRSGLDARLAAMTDILRRLPKPPVAVTICRSSRDGYAPRQQMSYIESSILAALKSVFGQLKIEYDPNLYYGREGWFNYKAKQLGDHFRWQGKKI